MSEHKKEAKASSAAKLQRMGLKLDDGSKSFTDERGGSPFEGLNSGNAGKMPITPSRFKRGGKVAHVMGEKAHKNLGKSTRKGRDQYATKGFVNSEDEKAPIIPYKSTQGGNTEASRYGAARYQAEKDADYATKRMEDYANPFDFKTGIQDEMSAAYTADRSLADRKAAAQQQGYGNYARGGLSSMNPAKRKAAIGAMVARKNKMGVPSAPPPSRGILPASVTPMSNPVPAMGRKRGGKAEHPDEAQDKKLMHKVLKPKAFKAKGGKIMHHDDCTCKMCSGGMAYRSKKFDGGGITGMNPMMQRPGTTQPNMMLRPPMGQGPGMGQSAMGQGPFNPMGNRPMRASGGRTKTGKTNVNIIISPQSGQGQAPLGAGVGMGQPPVPPMMPPMGGMPPMPPGGAMPPMMPPGGAPAGLPPQLMAALAAKGGAGGPPPMARKSGGRVGNVMPKYQEKDYGSGSGLGRLEKKKWPTANGTE